MENPPPSYEVATARDAWRIVAHYIPSSDLCAVSLVSRRWHEIFVPFLWGAPASHFVADKEAGHAALTRFRRVLKRSRLWVRELTHTLHLSSAPSGIYGGPKPSWLLELLEYLPNLQSLLVSQLPLFDHNSLMTLRTTPDEAPRQVYNLRLLLAASETNATASGLGEALLHFPRLAYLDLSYTRPSKDLSILHAISQLKNLQVLKVRGVGLKDEDAGRLATAIQARVRLLDVRNNLLTDMGLIYFLQNCFLPLSIREERATAGAASHYEWSQSDSPFSNILGADSFRNESLDSHFLKQLTVPLTGRFMVEDLSHVGITHIYIADNYVSADGLVALIKSSRLHVFDAGTMNGPGTNRPGTRAQFATPLGTEKLIPVFTSLSVKNMTYLRVHHAVIASVYLPDPESHSLHDPQTQGDSLLDSHESQFRLRGRKIVYQPANGRSSGDALPSSGKAEPSELPRDDNKADVYSLQAPDRKIQTQFSSNQARDDLIQKLLAKRARGCSLSPNGNIDRNFLSLHPSHLSNLRTLVLTDMPSSVPVSSHIVSNLIRFITACGDEALLSSLEAQASYSLPPGRSRLSAEQHLAKSLFGLERIIIEITSVAKTEGLTAWTAQGHHTPSAGKSSTEDPDSENLWAAAANDFSFFSQGESGVSDGDVNFNLDDDDSDSTPNFGIPKSRSRGEKSSHSQGKLPSRSAPKQPVPPQEPDIDVVAALAAFRRSRKATYEELVLRTGKMQMSPEERPVSLSSPADIESLYVEGFWKGEVKIVRNVLLK
ncbi:hypothetical protein AJ80_00796 [Polytolypa hystricis UAMH7299]|uniref:F-box domain-containing protein n=1 Tax=Polytolypa hystricis (strain UAMH7299) TaxID=1447883 RepID=A0A2B7Z1S7_POLH7|nr:hypothetical protein AJ80_00796 [Polytolypa hystricis UAMH7299]